MHGTLVGTVRFGETGNTIGATLVLMDTADRPTAVPGRAADAFTDIAVTGDGSVSNEAAAGRGHRRAAGRIRGAGRRADRRREPERPAAGTVVHHDFPAGVRRGRPGRRDIPDPEHVLDHRRPTHPGTRPAAGAGRLPPAGDPVGAHRGFGGRPGRVDDRPGPRLRPGHRTQGPVRRDRARPVRRRPGVRMADRDRRLCGGRADHPARRLPAGPAGRPGAAGRGDARRRGDAGVLDAPPASSPGSGSP